MSVEITSEKLFAIIGKQTVELAVFESNNQILSLTVDSLQKEIESLKNQAKDAKE